ncbi:MAG TPA: right-handed parallel beta-helix repeat-containing protein [Myxococcales bacterium]|nr:right-handed parallel beta-helix repeat-containing protein [Myxococcales bacterium]
MRTRLVATFCTLCAACGWPSARAEEQSRPPVVLVVRQPQFDVAALSPVGQPLLAPPQRAADGSEARPFRTLALALQSAPAGALLRVGEGLWRERLLIVRPVVLMGRGPGLTRLVAPDATGAEVDVRAQRVELRGLSIEGGQVGVRFAGGAGHRLEDVALRGSSVSGLLATGAGLVVSSSEVSLEGGGKTGRGIDVDGGSLEARKLVLHGAGRRAIVLHSAHGVLEDIDAQGAGLSALQVTDGADVRVVRGVYEGQGGAALYAGGARLTIEGAQVRHDDYAVIGYRGAEVSVVGGELTDYRVAGVALVKSHGSVTGAIIGHGGSEAAISILHSDGTAPVLITDNRIQDPGTMGVHITEARVEARGNTITGARLDREKDMGDAFYAMESNLVLERNVMRGNAGSGVAAVRSQLKLSDNGFIENGRAGLLLLDRSQSRASGNTFERNTVAAVEIGERARATLTQNRFDGNGRLDIDAGCGKGLAGTAVLGAGNTFAAPMRQRTCAE